MAALQLAETLSKPRWDGRRILFEIAHAAGEAPCTISVDAVQELAGRRTFRPAELLLGFEQARPQITAIAVGKWRARPPAASGLTHIWASDIDEQPEPAAPG
jgi:hypothetical protein